MPLQALSAGTSLTLCGVTPVATHCSVLEPQRLPHMIKTMYTTKNYKHFIKILLTCCTHTVAMVGSLEKQDLR